MKKEYKVVYAPIAKDDLRAIYRYIALELVEPAVAKNQVNRIRAAIRNLGTFPKKHTAVEWEPWLSMNMRKLPIDNYAVYYLVSEEHQQVTIVRVFYGGRDVESIVQNKEQE